MSIVTTKGKKNCLRHLELVSKYLKQKLRLHIDIFFRIIFDIF